MKHTNLDDEIEVHKGTDWLGIFFATVAAIFLAILIVDFVTGFRLHEIIGGFISK
jgi:hypothetical protein